MSIQGFESKIIQDQQVHFFDLADLFDIASVSLDYFLFIKQLDAVTVQYFVSVLTPLMTECRGYPTFSGTCGTNNYNILVFGNPVTCRKSHYNNRLFST